MKIVAASCAIFCILVIGGCRKDEEPTSAVSSIDRLLVIGIILIL
jgi:hypothetical protein